MKNKVCIKKTMSAKEISEAKTLLSKRRELMKKYHYQPSPFVDAEEQWRRFKELFSLDDNSA